MTRPHHQTPPNCRINGVSADPVKHIQSGLVHRKAKYFWIVDTISDHDPRAQDVPRCRQVGRQEASIINGSIVFTDSEVTGLNH